MDNERLIQLNHELNRMVNILINHYNPKKIILYGSLATGKIHKYSDIDLIVVKDSDKEFYERLSEVIQLTQPNLATEILVYTPEEFDEFKKSIFYEEEISKKGKVIFDA